MITHFNKEPILSHDERSKHQLSVRIDYSNTTDKTLSIIRRNGNVEVIPPSLRSSAAFGEFVIYHTINASPDIIHDMLESGRVTEYERLIYSEIQKSGNYNSRKCSMKYVLTSEDLDTNKSIYLENLDIVITSAKRDNLPDHPYSMGAILNGKTSGCVKSMFTYSLAMVNRLGTVAEEQYVNIGGIITRVPKMPSVTLPDGYYLTYGTGDDLKTKRYSLLSEDAPFTVHENRYLAETKGGDYSAMLKAIQKKEIEIEECRKTAELELKRAREDRERQQHLADVDKQLLSHVLLEQERLLDNFKKRIETDAKVRDVVVKSNSELQSSVRKDTSEWMKVVRSCLA